MPIKAKPIDPSRARLAARGQLHPTRQSAHLNMTPQNTPRSRASSSTSSDGSASGRRQRRTPTNCAPHSPTSNAPSFLTDGVPSEESDPELYRAARERTRRFLYPNGTHPPRPRQTPKPHLQPESPKPTCAANAPIDAERRPLRATHSIPSVSPPPAPVPDEEPVSSTRPFAHPPRSFAELQEQTLLQLYDAADDGAYFIATDYTPTAFSMAAEIASGGTSASAWRAPVPLSFLELDAAERARRNARAALRQDGASPPPDEDALLAADGAVLAERTTRALERFLAGVRCVESVARDPRLVDRLGRFLHAHHRHFLRSHGAPNGTGGREAVREFPHAAFAAYAAYSGGLGAFLTAALQRRVRGFSAEEFLSALHDAPREETEEDADEDDAAALDRRQEAMRILSFDSWRLLQSISSFDAFCALMDDFIAEEYGAGGAEEEVVVAAGVRSIRALLAKSRAQDVPPPAPPTPPTPLQRSEADPNSDGATHPTEAVASPIPPTQLSSPRYRLCAPFLHTPTPPSTASRLSLSQRSGRGSVTSFPRRPDAVPGRHLPPLDTEKAIGVASTPPPPTSGGRGGSGRRSASRKGTEREETKKENVEPPQRAKSQTREAKRVGTHGGRSTAPQPKKGGKK